MRLLSGGADVVIVSDNERRGIPRRWIASVVMDSRSHGARWHHSCVRSLPSRREPRWRALTGREIIEQRLFRCLSHRRRLDHPLPPARTVKWDAGARSALRRACSAKGLTSKGLVSDQTAQGISTLVDQVKQTATSSNAYMIYGSAAFFLTSGYLVWGAADNWGKGS